MTRIFTPILRISLGLVALTVGLILTAQALGLLPNRAQGQLSARAKTAEALAIQLSTAAGRNDLKTIHAVMNAVVERDGTILSIAMRKSDGTMIAQTGKHDSNWENIATDASTPTHVRVPIHNGGARWGRVEIVFTPLSSSFVFSVIPEELAVLLLYLVLAGFFAYYIILRRALREIDPRKAIPQRVQAAFDALAEGVLVIDKGETILLANGAISDAMGKTSDELFGTKTSDLAWRQWSTDGHEQELPWRTAMSNKTRVTGLPMNVRTPSGDIQRYSVNSSPITDEKGRIHGAIATFDNVTDLQRKNEQLNQANRQLKESQLEVRRQNHELRYLATRDPLSGCLNRRSFFAEFDRCLAVARTNRRPLSVVMVDLDHFKSINDNYGHSVGDEVIKHVGEILRSSCREQDLVGRYGGEEFCLVVEGLTKQACASVAERIRLEIESRSRAWLRSTKSITASFGVSMLVDDDQLALDLVNQADKALYEAKSGGRNRVVFWDDLNVAASEILQTKRSSTESDRSLSTSHKNHCGAQVPENSPQPFEVETTVFQPEDRGEFDISARLSSEPIFQDRVSQSIRRGKRNGSLVAVLYIALESYDRAADAFDDGQVNFLLSTAVDRITDVLRRSDTVSLSSNEFKRPVLSQLADAAFALELPDLQDAESIIWIVKRLRSAISDCYQIGGHEITMNFSIGISVHPRDGDDAPTLVRNARTAARFCQRTMASEGYSFYSQEMNERSRQQLLIESGLRRATEVNDFSVVYQPILNAQTLEITSVEALLRCNNSALRDVSVHDWIIIAEQTGLIVEIGERALKTAIIQFQNWQRSGLVIPKLSVNLSPVQLRDPSAVDRLIQIVDGLGFPAKMLQLEITETTMIDDSLSIRDRLERLQVLGVQIALDDFGTGHSSLCHLRQFQPDVLKIDRSFVDNIRTNQNDATMVSAIIAMCHQMGIVVVAEGIETEEQLERLRLLQCDDVQGYLFAEPFPAPAFATWLRASKIGSASEAA